VSADRPRFGLLDTSVIVAAECGRSVRGEALPERAAISIVTHAELRTGVLAASDVEARDRRLATLERLSGTAVLQIEEEVARVWAGMRAYLVASGRRLNTNDAWIAATAGAHEIPIVTQDRDFYALSGVGGLTVIEV
jgi:predicted nucleic acid-binding protein